MSAAEPSGCGLIQRGRRRTVAESTSSSTDSQLLQVLSRGATSAGADVWASATATVRQNRRFGCFGSAPSCEMRLTGGREAPVFLGSRCSVSGSRKSDGEP